MHAYRTHTCGALTAANVGETIRLSGWIHRKRDHGGVLFVDLRDHYGITQIVADEDSPALEVLDGLRVESVVTIDGEVKARSEGTINPNLPTGEIEVYARGITVQSRAEELPMPVAGEQEYPEEIRLKNRFLDLRREKVHANIVLRSQGHLLDPPAHDRRRALPNSRPRSWAHPAPKARATIWCPARLHPGKFLCAAAGAADVQAAADGRRFRPLFPDRPLLPRRGPARRPQP